MLKLTLLFPVMAKSKQQARKLIANEEHHSKSHQRDAFKKRVMTNSVYITRNYDKK